MKRAVISWWKEIPGGTRLNLEILSELLTKAGYKPILFPMDSPSAKLSRLKDLIRLIFLSGFRRFDLFIALQYPHKEKRVFAKRTILIPNQEHTDPAWLENWDWIDRIACKTRHAYHEFGQRNLSVTYMGFRSIDMFTGEKWSSEDEFLHVAGKSELKGTRRLIDFWLKHPELPKLTVLWQVPGAKEIDFELQKKSSCNLILIKERLSLLDLKSLMNRIPHHLCLSESEGFGHYIQNSLSVGAIVFVTDGEPMNEHVREDWGFKVFSTKGKPLGLSNQFLFDEDDLLVKIRQCLKIPIEKRLLMGSLARTHFAESSKKFEAQFNAIVNE